MFNTFQYNTTLYNASSGNIIFLNLFESEVLSDDEMMTFTKTLTDTLATPTDVLINTVSKTLSESVFFSDNTTLLLEIHKVMVENIRMTAWLRVQRPGDHSNFTQVS